MSAPTPPAATATYLGTATVLLRIGDLVLLTDPALDPPEAPQEFRVPKTPMRIPLQRTRPACLPPDDLPHLDAVLLSHDQHPDNFDTSGRAVAANADLVLTTTAGARRLRGNAHGLQPWQSVVIERGSTQARVTATPARHGPPGMDRVVGDVIGFVIEAEGLDRALYISGDTVLHDGLTEIGQRFTVGPALLHLGRARFPATGSTTYSLGAHEAATLAGLINATTVLPVHYDDWAHFTQTRDEAAAALRAAGTTTRWMVPGEPVDLLAAGLLHPRPTPGPRS
ncbi:MBL fold metallo-hydrolase [Micromonospora sp. NPDC049497]|uniref:MBL fold metallo-hydrolase n=1 Tax=Micromonospora sp. NPDC049497 TaxID=3364273 RepID=UPI003790C5A5